MAIYKPTNAISVSNITSGQRMSNQIVISGTNQQFIVTGGAFYLESIDVSSGTVDVSDGAGIPMASIGTHDFNDSPMICEDGIQMVGTVLMAKGFAVYSDNAFNR